MGIDPQTIGGVAVAIPALAALIGLGRGPSALRSRLKHDAEVLAALPADSAAHSRLLEHIDTQVERLTKSETEWKRDWSGFSAGIVITVPMGALILWLLTRDHWAWWLLAGPTSFVTIAGVVVIFESIQRVPRDAKGHRV